ncbi:hypothetical protein [Pedobacter panaciterrae]
MKILELEEIKDKVAQSRGFQNWRGKLEHEHRGLFELEVLDRITDQVAEHYAEQFKPKWIPVKKELPESRSDLVITKEDLERTELLLVMTDMGSVVENWRIKMAIGEKEWTWFMNISDENILFWTPYPQSLKDIPV